jgi:hypothetical protein
LGFLTLADRRRLPIEASSKILASIEKRIADAVDPWSH